MAWRGNLLVITVILVLFLGSRTCCSLTADETNHNAGNKDKREDLEFLPKHPVRRGVGDELTALKDKAKKASSVYRWLKDNWKKIFVIIVAIFTLVVVVGIYRRCFSDSGSSGNDEEPSIVVVRMLKQGNQGSGECLDPIVAGGVNQERGDNGKKETSGYETHKVENREKTRKTQEMTTGGRTQKTIATTNVRHHAVKRSLKSPTGLNLVRDSHKTHFQESRVVGFLARGIPISGYTVFQQIEFSMAYFHFIQYLLEVKKTNQLRAQPPRICQGSTSKGPFPFYEEIPLVRILIASSIEKYCDNYIPTANTKTNLPLTISP